ncbi:hypothetical protein TruAng_008384 [Truncatella angustata]|nr:hypothetical protein TruAng_008384 [Truncatella angustata]
MEPSDLCPFVYNALVDPTSEFRVLRLEPAQHGEPISGNLETVAGNVRPHYSALSYTWGPKSDGKVITIDGHAMAVTSNCESALRHIRKTGESTMIWVDAICIDQENIPEKGAQINQMREIYTQASDVIIWLGDQLADASLAFETLRHISELGKYNAQEATSRTVGTAEGWQAVENLFRREWFERIWVVQEVSLAKMINIRCGSNAMSWTMFNRALQWYYEDIAHLNGSVTKRGSLIMNAMEVRNAWAGRKYGSGREPRLENLLSQFSHWKATVLVDKVNALLGMSREHATPELQPDYTKSVYQTYTAVVKYLIRRDKRLCILGLVQNPPMYQGEAPDYKPLPSWVPDWTANQGYLNRLSEPFRPEGDAQMMVTTTGDILIPGGLYMPESFYGAWHQGGRVREEMNFRASLDVPAEYYFPTASQDRDVFDAGYFRVQGPEFDPEGLMSLKGIKVDTVHSVTTPMFRVVEDFEDLTFFLKWEKFAILQMPPAVDCPYGGTFEGRLDAFWRTITTNRIHTERAYLKANPICRQIFEQWRAKLVENTNRANGHQPENFETEDNQDPSANYRLLLSVMAKIDISGDSPLGEDELLRDYEKWKQNIAQRVASSNVIEPPPSDIQEFTLPNLERTLSLWCFARKLARLASGRLALVPEHTRPGDQVFVLYGGSVPYVVRPLPGRGKTKGYYVDEHGERGPAGATYQVITPMHQFVGEAYVHGIMDGEALEYPSIHRLKRVREVKLSTAQDKGTPESEAAGTFTVLKEVFDPLTPEQEEMVTVWREWLRSKKEQDVWFDHTTSAML